MSLETKSKQKIIKKFGDDPKDTGSAQVQVALLTERIKELTEHFRSHPKDHHSRRGLFKLVGSRRRMLDYLMKVDSDAYKKLIKELNIRK